MVLGYFVWWGVVVYSTGSVKCRSRQQDPIRIAGGECPVLKWHWLHTKVERGGGRSHSLWLRTFAQCRNKFSAKLWVPSNKWKETSILFIKYKNFTTNGGGVQLPNWWQLRKLVARSAMRCAKLVVPETGFVGEEKFCLSSDGGGVWNWVPINQKSSPEVRFNGNWLKNLEKWSRCGLWGGAR